MSANAVIDRIEFAPTICEADARAILDVVAMRPPAESAGARLVELGLADEMPGLPSGLVVTRDGWNVLAFWRKGGGFAS